VGDLEVGIRPSRVEVADVDLLDCRDDQSFLASGDGCELGAGIVLSGAACDACVVVSGGVSHGSTGGCVLADASSVDVVGEESWE